MERKIQNFSSLLSRSGEIPLFETARRLCQIVHAAGGRALFVGGCVRDLLMGKTPKDIDLECYGLSPEKLLRVLEPHFPLDPVGMSFGVIRLRHRAIDVSLPRRENKRGQGHRGFLVSLDPQLTVAEAAARRDFTVNAMLWDPLTEEFFDPWGGKKDLADGILRHISEHFSEDPLRVLRAMQFSARFRFSVAPETVRLCRRISPENLPPERLAGEWDKLLLQGVAPSFGLHFLADCTWDGFFPGVDSALRNAGIYPMMDAAASRREGDEREKRLFMLAVFSSFFPDEETTAVFVQGIWKQKDLWKNLLPVIRYRKELRDFRSDAELRRLAVAALSPSLLLAVSHLLAGEASSAVAANEKRMRELGIAEIPPPPLLQGRDLAPLGVRSGKEMGQILRELFEAQLDGSFSDKEGALSFFRDRYGQKKV